VAALCDVPEDQAARTCSIVTHRCPLFTSDVVGGNRDVSGTSVAFASTNHRCIIGSRYDLCLQLNAPLTVSE
jgi:hypothetical protein